MRERPSSVRISGMAWKVRAMSKAELFMDSGDSLLGQSKHTEAELQIRNDMPPDRERLILWHEIFHAVENEAGFSFSEEQVRGMAAGLFAVLRDNPAFTTWLLEEAS